MDRDEEVSSSVHRMNGVKEHEFCIQNRDALQISAVAPGKQGGQFRELLISAKEISRVGNVTGTPNLGVDIARETYGVLPKKNDKLRVNQDDNQLITRQQMRTLQLLAKAEHEQVSILIEQGAPQVN